MSTVTFRIPDEERIALEAQALLEGINLSEHIRRTLVRREQPEDVVAQVRDLARRMDRLEQIAGL